MHGALRWAHVTAEWFQLKRCFLALAKPQRQLGRPPETRPVLADPSAAGAGSGPRGGAVRRSAKGPLGPAATRLTSETDQRRESRLSPPLDPLAMPARRTAFAQLGRRLDRPAHERNLWPAQAMPPTAHRCRFGAHLRRVSSRCLHLSAKPYCDGNATGPHHACSASVLLESSAEISGRRSPPR